MNGVLCRSDDYDDGYDIGNEPMSVVKLQVGLMGSARGLQRDLNRMGNSIDTSTPEGLHYLLTETVLALRRNPQYALYGEYYCPLVCSCLFVNPQSRLRCNLHVVGVSSF
jgi:uncharacterized membrane protein